MSVADDRAAAAPSASKSRRGFRDVLRLVHLWVGLILGVPLCLLSVTGSILVIQPELMALSSEMPQIRDPQAPRRPLGEIVGAAAAVAPAGQVPLSVLMPESANDPVTVRLAAARRAGPGPGGSQLFIDPASLEVLSTRDSVSPVWRTIHILHGNALIQDRVGRQIIGWLGVIMLLLGLTGPILWWPAPGRWRQAFTVKRGARGLRLHRDLHGAVGIWSLGVFLIVSFTGVYIAFPQTVAGILGGTPPRDFRSAPAVKPVAGGTPMDLDAAAALATGAIDQGRIRLAFLATRPDQAYRFLLRRPGDFDGAPSAEVLVDPWARQIMEIRDPRLYSTSESLIAWQRPLHQGEGLGLVWRILVFLVGLVPVLFAITGTYMWLLKRRARAAGSAKRLVPNAAE